MMVMKVNIIIKYNNHKYKRNNLYKRKVIIQDKILKVVITIIIKLIFKLVNLHKITKILILIHAPHINLIH